MILYQKNIWVKSFGQKNIWVEKFLLKKSYIIFGQKHLFREKVISGNDFSTNIFKNFINHA